MVHQFVKALRLASFLTLVALAFLAMPAQAQVIEDPIVPVDHPLAPFLESRAYAKSVGATAEFRKMEWVALDTVNQKVYWAMSEVSKGMSDGEGDVNVEENLCGIVYAGDYDENFNVSGISPLIVGGPYDETNEDNPCDVNNIANPDNLFVDGRGRLWIGEDTSKHANNVLWMWDGALHRFGTVPAGAEATGLYVTSDGTLFFNVQHPSGVNPHPYNRGLVGVVNGFKATDEFTDLPVPEGADRNKVMVAAGEYQILGRVGNPIAESMTGARFGEIHDVDGSAMGFCNQPDSNMYLPTVEDGSEGYLYSNYECETAGVSRIYIRNNGASWDVIEGGMVDFTDVNGVWTLCGGTVTPWNTALTSEEFEPLATLGGGWQDNVEAMSEYMGEQANPYDYGWQVEMMPDEDGDLIDSLVQKQYAMGRFSHENAIVMPDGKTVYHGDDGTDVVFFKTVADAEGDLSAGTIYAAKATQQDDGSFAFEWIELGKGTNDEIAEYIATMELPQ
jgi:secreted PhoX family phosphatase